MSIHDGRFDIRVDYTGYYFGILGFVAMAFLFFPVCRGSALLRLLNIPFEHAVKYHTWVGFTTIFIFLVHTVIYYAYWWRRGEIGEKVGSTCIPLDNVMSTPDTHNRACVCACGSLRQSSYELDSLHALPVGFKIGRLL